MYVVFCFKIVTASTVTSVIKHVGVNESSLIPKGNDKLELQTNLCKSRHERNQYFT